MSHVYDDQLDGPRYLWPVEPRSAPVVHAPPARPSRRYRAWLAILWIAGMIFVVCAVTETPTSRHSARSILLYDGLRGVVTRGGPRFPQLDEVPFRLDDADRHRNKGILPGPAPGVTVQLDPGTTVRMIQAGERGSLVQVTQGQYYGRIGWVPQGYAWPASLSPSMTGLQEARKIN